MITIIGILAALITVAASGRSKKARQTRIKVEIDQIGAGDPVDGRVSAELPDR